MVADLIFILLYYGIFSLHENFYKKIIKQYPQNNNIFTILKTTLCEIIYQYSVFDTIFYCVHRFIFHNKFLYDYIHKIHHHAIVPVKLHTFYAHPIENIITLFNIFTCLYSTCK